MGLSAGSKQFNYFKKFNKFHKMLCKDEDMIDCRKTNRCFVLLLLAKTDQGRQLLWRLIFFFVSQRSSSSYILYPCHLTDAVSDKFVLVMKKQLFVKEMYHLQCHVIPSTRREVFLALLFLYQSTKPSFKTWNYFNSCDKWIRIDSKYT